METLDDQTQVEQENNSAAEVEIIDETQNDICSVSDTDSFERPRNKCQAVVEQIRREEFGVDVMLSEDGQKLMLKQQERLGRSLDRLSKDLYSKDTHFVLELVQNADDNDYPDELYRYIHHSCMLLSVTAKVVFYS